jgi:hypothetical protein
VAAALNHLRSWRTEEIMMSRLTSPERGHRPGLTRQASAYQRRAVLLAAAVWMLGCATDQDVTNNPLYAGDYVKGTEYVLRRPAVLTGNPVGENRNQEKYPSLYIHRDGQDSLLAAGTRVRFERLNLHRSSFVYHSIDPVAEIISGPFAGNHANIAAISRTEIDPNRFFVDPGWLEPVHSHGEICRCETSTGRR